MLASKPSGRRSSPAGETFAGALVERLVDERYSMTRHALSEHAPEGAIFAVSSFGPGAIGNRPPAELQPMGLEGPLSWLADQLEARDRAVDDPTLGAGPETCPARAHASPPTSDAIRARTGPSSFATV